MTDQIIEVKASTLAPGFEINPQNFEEAQKWCSYLSHSQMVPKNFQTPEGSKIDKGANIYAAIIKGAELGLKPMQALNAINVIEGRISLSTDAKKAVCMRFGKISQTYSDGNGNPTWTVKVERPGFADVEISYSAVDAAQADLMKVKTLDSGVKVWSGVKGAWCGYWKRMLLKRAMSWALDDAFPDILSGLATTEEIQDLVAPAPAAQAKTEIVGEAEEVTEQSTESLDAAERILNKMGDK